MTKLTKWLLGIITFLGLIIFGESRKLKRTEITLANKTSEEDQIANKVKIEDLNTQFVQATKDEQEKKITPITNEQLLEDLKKI